MQSSIVILGGTSLVARYLVARLHREDRIATVASRRPVALPPGFTPVDFATPGVLETRLSAEVTAVSLLPLSDLVGMLPRLKGIRAIVALGSTSVFSKARSDDPAERAFAARLAAAEDAMARWCRAEGVRFTLLRPTLVYDFAGDKNIARMARLIRRVGVLPLAVPASGLRQPIHADDIAKAILSAVGNSAAADRAFDIAGGEPLAYRAMAERVFAGVGRRPRFILLPTSLLKAAFGAARAVGLVREKGFGANVFQRMNEDLIFDVADGLRILRYDPRPFDLVAPPRPGDLDYRAISTEAGEGGEPSV